MIWWWWWWITSSHLLLLCRGIWSSLHHGWRETGAGQYCPTYPPTSSKFLPLPHFLWQTLFGVFLQNVPKKKPSFVWMASRSHKLRYICYKAFAFARAELNLISKLCNFLQFQAQCMQARNISALQCSRRHLVDSNEMAAKQLDTKQHQKKITDAVLH